MPVTKRFPSAAKAGLVAGDDSDAEVEGDGREYELRRAGELGACAGAEVWDPYCAGDSEGDGGGGICRSRGVRFKAAEAADTADACPWDPDNWGVKDNAAGQAWYDSLMRQYAGWGVDLIEGGLHCFASVQGGGDSDDSSGD